MKNRLQNSQNSLVWLLFMAIISVFLIGSACNLITSDPCDDTEVSAIEVEIKATVNLTVKNTGEPLSDVLVYLTISKQPCGGEKKGMFNFNNFSDSLGNVYSDQVKYSISNLDDLIYIDAMVKCSNGQQGLWSSCLKYEDFVEMGFSQVIVMNLEIDKDELKQGTDSPEIFMNN